MALLQSPRFTEALYIGGIVEAVPTYTLFDLPTDSWVPSGVALGGSLVYTPSNSGGLVQRRHCGESSDLHTYSWLADGSWVLS